MRNRSCQVVSDVATTFTSEVVAIGIRPDGFVVIAREDSVEIVDRHDGPTGVTASMMGVLRSRADGSVFKENADFTTDIVNIDGFGLAALDQSSWLDRACEIAGRDLTTAEWQEFAPEGEAFTSTCA